jgi:long-subunit acyl-CoA synthetase (AMP-forming)
VNLKNDAAGRVLLKSDQLFDGYYGDPLSTKEALKNGWFNTGAPGRLDEEGFLYLGENPRQRPAG